MQNGIEYLRAAATRLENQGQLRREDVAQAANDFCNAMLHIEQMPEELMESAGEIQALIASQGTVDRNTVNRKLSTLSNAEVWYIADLIWNFVARAELLLREE